MTFRNDCKASIVKAMDRAIHELQAQRAYVAACAFNDADTIKGIGRSFAKEAADPVLHAIAKGYTDCPDEYRSIVSDAIDGDLLFDIGEAEKREREYWRDEAADHRRASRSDYDEHNTLNRVQQGV